MTPPQRITRPSFTYVLTVLWTTGLVLFLPLLPLMMVIDERLALVLWSLVFATVLGTVVARLARSGVAIERDELVVTTTLRTSRVTRGEALGMGHEPVWFTPAASQRVPALRTSVGRPIKFTLMIGRSSETIDRVTADVRRWHSARAPEEKA